ncbi:MAG: WbqC family protein [Bacteroidia bacterium]
MISIHQSQFLSWCPYYYKVLASDNFVILDDVQFQKNGVQNRNMIKTPMGASWITIPVKHDLQTIIKDVEVSDVRCYEKIIRTFESNYKKSKNYDYVLNSLVSIFGQSIKKLDELNNLLFLEVLKHLKPNNLSVSYSSQLNTVMKKDDLVIEIIKKIGDNEYLSGRGALSYMDLEKFKKENIKVYTCEFTPTPYSQLWESRVGFIKDLSVIDLLFNELDNAHDYLMKNGSFNRIV